MSGLISGGELMKQWDIDPYELLHRFIKKGLIAYNEEGQEVSPEELFDGIEDLRPDSDKINAWTAVELPGSDGQAQQMLEKISVLYFDERNVQFIGETFHLAAKENLEATVKSKPKPKHHTEMHKLNARAVAAKLWAKKYKNLSVPELIDTQEMLDATLKSDGRYKLFFPDRQGLDKGSVPQPAFEGGS